MKINKLLFAARAMLCAGSLAAQSIDLGRGESQNHRRDNVADLTWNCSSQTFQ